MSNSAPTSCPHCGAPLTESAAQGLCPRCLLALNLEAPTAFTGSAAHTAPGVPLTPEELAPHFPQLEILSCLGRGGMGVVYQARQRSLNRFVALKLLAPERAGDTGFAERFTREAHALAALNHPHIVTVYDFGQAGGFYFLLMEFVDGVNLRQAMAAGRFTPEEALAVVPPVCEALQYAHEHGIVHRDIKPENLLLDKAGRVKIADFGVAKILGADDPGETSPAGTPPYMAPEQKEHRRTDHRADIYSLGVVLYEMLTGELPPAQLRAPSTRLHGLQIDVRLDEIVLRALEKTPELRYQTAAEMRTEAETVAGTQATRAAASSVRPLREDWLLGFFAALGIRSPGAVTCARLAGLGFLGFLGWLPGLGIMSGAFGLFGLLGLAVIVQLGSGERPASRESLPPAGFSRLAVIGAVWAATFFFVTVLFNFAVSPVRSSAASADPSWIDFVGKLLLALLAVGWSAPLGTTILGWIAVARIRAFPHRLRGLELAVFDGLLFPLLCLDGLIVGLWWQVARLVTDFYRSSAPVAVAGGGGEMVVRVTPPLLWRIGAHFGTNQVTWLLCAVTMALLVDWLIVRRVWQAVRVAPVSGEDGGAKEALAESGKGGAVLALSLCVLLLAGFFALLFGLYHVRSSAQVSPAAEAPIEEVLPKSSSLSVPLSHGGMVVLHAFGKAGDPEGVWWAPNGTPIPGDPEWERFRQGPAGGVVFSVYEAVHPGAHPPVAPIGPLGEKWAIPLYASVPVSQSVNGHAPALVMGFGAGAWQTRGKLIAGQPFKKGDFEALIDRVDSSATGSTTVHSWFTVLPENETALVVVDKHGNRTPLGMTSGPDTDPVPRGTRWEITGRTTTVVDDIDYFELISRPRCWALFRGYAATYGPVIDPAELTGAEASPAEIESLVGGAAEGDHKVAASDAPALRFITRLSKETLLAWTPDGRLVKEPADIDFLSRAQDSRGNLTALWFRQPEWTFTSKTRLGVELVDQESRTLLAKSRETGLNAPHWFVVKLDVPKLPGPAEVKLTWHPPTGPDAEFTFQNVRLEPPPQ